MVTRSGTSAALVADDRFTPHRFEDRLARLCYATIGLAGLVSLAIYLPQVEAEYDTVEMWWSVPALASVVVTSTLLAAVSFVLTRRWLDVVCAIAAITMILSVITWPLAFTGPTIGAALGRPLDSHDDIHPWVWGLYVVSATAAAAVWSVRVTAAYIVVLSAGVAYVNALGSANTGLAVMAEDFIFLSTYAAIYCAMISILMSAGRTLDASIHASKVSAGAAAAAEARTIERDRLDALIHDSIMSTLMNAAQHADDGVMVHQAKAALRQLDHMAGPHEAGAQFTAVDAVAYIRAASMHAGDSPEFSSSVFRNADPIDGDVVRAVSGATEEAVRNSYRHSGGARTRVTVRATAGGLSVEVRDNGLGFDPALVPRDRLGLGVSIIGRMSSIRGGSTSVRSAPGAGTTVSIVWARVRT